MHAALVRAVAITTHAVAATRPIQISCGKPLSDGQLVGKSLQDMSSEKFATRNMHGVVASAVQVYELTRELKRDHLRSLGLGSNRLHNMVLAEEAIIAQDKKMRRNGRSPSGECLGILRMNNWCNGVDVRL